MIGSLVLVAFWLGVGWLLYRDHKERSVSSATWIVVAWAIIQGSRPVTSWLSGVNETVAPEDYDEGHVMEALVYLALVVSGLLVLLRRRIRLAAVLRDNPWLTAFWVFWLASILWSDYPMITLKRLVKDLGNVVMVLVILSGRDPVETIKAVFTRCAYLCIPLSILLIRYYPHLGRFSSGYDRSEMMFVGVTTHKNSLGVLAMVSALFLLWDLLDTWRQARTGPRRVTYGARVFTLLMCWYLLAIAQSATSLACAGLGSALLMSFTVPWGRNAIARLAEVMAIGFFVLDSLFGLREAVILGLGRDLTLTTRTEIWPILYEYQTNALLGAGFNSFWAGHRLVELRDSVGGIIQAHNGYLETYLNGGLVGVALLLLLLFSAYVRAKAQLVDGTPVGRIVFVLLSVAIIYNLSEASFSKLSLLWFATVLVITRYPAPAAEPVLERDRPFGAAAPGRAR
jgi:hypothetical protein